jgi:hypothetical protein
MNEAMTEKCKRKPREKCELTAKQRAYLEAKTVEGNPIIPVSKQSLLRRAYEGTSLRAAVKAMCCDCYGWETVGDAGQCPSESCPLWPNRPFQKNEEEEDVELA